MTAAVEIVKTVDVETAAASAVHVWNVMNVHSKLKLSLMMDVTD